MSTIPLHLERRCQQRWAARFARQAQKETVGQAEPARPPKSGLAENPIKPLASQGIDKNLRAPGPSGVSAGRS
jgi:hypothetical protein